MFKELMTDISSRKDTRFNNRIIFAHKPQRGEEASMGFSFINN